MSLLNDMLKDIEKRQAEQTLPESLVLSTRPQRSTGKPLLIAALLAAAAGGGAYYWYAASRPSIPSALHSPQHTKTAPAPATDAGMAAIVEAAQNAAHAQNAGVHKSEAAAKAAAQSVTAAPSAAGAPRVAAVQPVAAKPTVPVSAPPAVIQPAATAPPAKVVVSGAAGSQGGLKVIRPPQRSDNLYRQALGQLQQGRAGEAQRSLQQALEVYAANHAARQLLAELLSEAGQPGEAETLLREDIGMAPDHTGLRMTLAQIQGARGETAAAITTLEQGLPAAGDDANYHAMLAALQQKLGHHSDAIGNYLVALRENPAMPAWLIGAGISLQAENRFDDAEAAFQRALDTGELSEVVAEFASRRLAQIRQDKSRK